LLTDLFRLRCRGVDPDRYARLEELAPHFGLGLQLTNVTRDMADDIPAGRNFVPRELWQQSGLEPAALFRPGHETESWRVGAALSADASKYLRDALAYCCELPRTAFRVRFFCYTSLIFAARTLALIDKERDRFVRGQRIKMPRREVRLLLAATFICVPSNTMLRLLFHRIARDRGNG
jgi:farnesyl-diphosphate farnesyltransferase